MHTFPYLFVLDEEIRGCVGGGEGMKKYSIGKIINHAVGNTNISILLITQTATSRGSQSENSSKLSTPGYFTPQMNALLYCSLFTL